MNKKAARIKIFIKTSAKSVSAKAIVIQIQYDEIQQFLRVKKRESQNKGEMNQGSGRLEIRLVPAAAICSYHHISGQDGQIYGEKMMLK